MIFTLQKTSEWDFIHEVDIYSLEDLQALQEEYDNELIVDFVRCHIEVYDTFRENGED